ncbi:hypothetical protein CRUP_032550 [Coryphaenoides rupestris]|nr:hypothetical protein CRUP_032550 [Coryphaenoides rupestris]
MGPADLSSAQCIPAPLATPIPVSDDPATPVVTPCAELSEGPGGQGLPPMPYSSPVQGAIPTNLPNTAVALRPPYSPGLPAPSPQLPPAYFSSSSSVSQVSSLEPYPPLAQRDQGSTQAQEALGGAYSSSAGDGDSSATAGGLDSLSEYTLPGGRLSHSFIPGVRYHNAAHMNGQGGTNLSMLSRNPLAATHEFRQACHACYSRIGPRVMDYQYQPEAAHRCKRDVLLCRLKDGDDPTWKRVRPRPARNNFLGAFVLCKEVQERQECQYGENCTFAYCQEEIDVWTQERKGALSRELLFDPLGSTERRALSVTRLLQLHMGMFIKPRIISKRSKENLAVCSNLTARHPFDDNNCSFAHSVIELKCWVLQQDTGITHEEMVQESKRHWHRLEQNGLKQQKPMHIPHHSNHMGSVGMGGGGICGGGGGGGDCMGGGGSAMGGMGGVSGMGAGPGRGRGLNLKMKFVCGQCWRDGQVNEPDKNLKYCTAKARHSWTKERRVLLVKSFEKKKWVVVRPLPFSRTYPQQYDMCVHVMKQKKCHYIGNCSFAHSLEERDVWTYMKNNSLRDMQQMYDMWLQLTNQSRRTDGPLLTPPPEEKQVTMTADYSEGMGGQRLSEGDDL